MRDYVVLDVFTDTPLQGNALAVFIDGTGLGGELMQRAARELNLSETVFLLPDDAVDGGCDARVRIFTPALEMPFAGHPVLGSAFVVGERDGIDRVRLRTGSGVIVVELQRDGDRIVHGEMEQPVPVVSSFERVDDLLAALGVGRPDLPIEVYDNGMPHVCVTLQSGEQVAGLRPDLGALADLGVFPISCFAQSGDHVRTRMFAPRLGVNEDPATGSAAGPIALHLARHGRTRFGEQIELRQGVEVGRPSRLFARVEGSAEQVTKVAVGGGAVLVARGSYLLG